MYITVMAPPRTHQVSLEEILAGEVALERFNEWRSNSCTVTGWRNNIPAALQGRFSAAGLTQILNEWIDKNRALYDVPREQLYYTFYIPKKSGGYRRIDAPNEELMFALRELKSIFENQFGALYHTSAFAYVKHRSTVDCVRRHQKNESKWFLKTDFSNFFGSTTEPFLMDMLSNIFPFCLMTETVEGKNALQKALNLCMLNGGLPQGTPISPTLTNIMMIPFDFILCNSLRKKGFVYTRYADDILISHKLNFNQAEPIKMIRDTLAMFNAPFDLKPSKTRYGSISGSNWNLGLMLNSDNEITVGWRQKKRISAGINSFILDTKNNVHWDPHDIQVLAGQLSYYKMVEEETIKKLITHYEQRHGVCLKDMIRGELQTRVSDTHSIQEGGQPVPVSTATQHITTDEIPF